MRTLAQAVLSFEDAMNRLEKFLVRIFPSNAATGRIGSIEFTIWMNQLTGVPILGLKPESTWLKALLLAYGFFMVVIVAVCYTAFEFWDLVMSWNNLDVFSQNSCLSFTHFGGLWKIFNVFYHLKDIDWVIKRLQFLTRTYVVSDKQLLAFISGESQNKLFLMIFASLVGFTGSMAIVLIVYNPRGLVGEVFPFRVKMPSWLPYELQLSHMAIGLLFIAMQIVALDYMHMAMMNQIRYQLNILMLSVDELRLDGKQQLELKDPTAQLKSIIEHHCILMDVRNQIENIYSTPMLVQFLTSMILFGLSGFQATVRTGGANVDLIMYFYCGCILSELLLFCWVGNDVYEKSKTLSTCGYSSAWYQLDQRFRKSLLLFLTNAQRPLMFTAGGFMILSLPSFGAVLRRSYTFIVVLRQLYNE